MLAERPPRKPDCLTGGGQGIAARCAGAPLQLDEISLCQPWGFLCQQPDQAAIPARGSPSFWHAVMPHKHFHFLSPIETAASIPRHSA